MSVCHQQLSIDSALCEQRPCIVNEGSLHVALSWRAHFAVLFFGPKPLRQLVMFVHAAVAVFSTAC